MYNYKMSVHEVGMLTLYQAQSLLNALPIVCGAVGIDEQDNKAKSEDEVLLARAEELGLKHPGNC